ncbi:MAG: hypothetical protein RBT61_10765 [Candidatus Kapabacteria bacterium]|jgi:hypothetical protein|nr:hypothetical protein [Candidatus Kapabacteria bacterium]
MAELTISGRMKVKSLKADFKKAFGSTLRVYNGAKFADDDATLASIRKGDAKGGEVKAHGATKVGNFEKSILENYGIKIQVASPDDTKLVSDDMTLSASGK